MADKKTTYTLEIDAEIGQLKNKLNDAQKALNKIGDSNFSKGFDKKIASILNTIDKLQKKAGQPIDSKSTFSSLEKGFGNIVVDAKNLLAELNKLSSLTTKEKLSLLPEKEAERLKNAISAVQAYERAVEKLEKARIKAQEKRGSDKKNLESNLAEARKSLEQKQKTHKAATAKGTAYGDARALLEQRAAAEKAQKEIDSLEKSLKKYQKRLEELNAVSERSAEQEAELAEIRSNLKSVGGKIGARKKIVNKDPSEKDITGAQNIIEKEAPAIEQMEKEISDTEKEILRLVNSIDKLQKALEKNGDTITSSQADYKILYEQAKKLGVSLENVTEDVSSDNVKLLTERMKEMVNEGVKPLEVAMGSMTPELRQVGEVAQTTGEKVAQASENFDALAESDQRVANLKNNIKQFIGWAGASRVLSAALRNAFQDIKELDAAMTEIAVVTDFDIGDMWDQMPQYTERANELGLAITEVYEASALYYQQGLDTNEMIALSNETLKMAKIAGLDAAEATDRMTAALRGFNMELDQASAQKVADVYSELAAITASDVNEISSAMTKTASIASSAGMEFETTAAFLSQIIETTRESAETAGTAMKTVIARFQELKKAPDEIGEIDGEIVDANAIEGALRSVGVSLRDSSGQFRELDEVFLELSSKWDGLDKNTQRYIATIAAGSRQQSRFIAMMQDYERTQELVAAANNSAGASQEQYEKTLDSIETKLAQLDNAWTEFSTGLMNSDLVKFAVEFLTSLLNALNKVTQGFEGFTASLSKVGTLIAIFQTAKAIVGKFFDEVIAKVYTASVRAGESIAQGTRDGIEGKGSTSGGPGRLIGYSQIKEGLDMRKEAKRIQGRVGTQEQVERYRNAKNSRIAKKDNVQAQYEKEVLDAGTDVIKIKDAQIKRNKELSKIDKELAAIEKHRYYTQEEVDELSKKSFKTICDGAQEAAQSLTVVGAGLGMIGQMFTEMELEGIGNFFSETGKYVTMFGSAMMAIIPIVKLVGTTFKIEGNKIVFAGVKAQAAWWWVFLIVAAVATLAIGISAAVKAAKNNSMEKKFEQLAEGADAAAEAAEKMASSYENLKNSLKGIDDIQTNLDNMVQGTDAWKEAVEELNDEVLKLIKEYPQLAKFVKNENGVLSIDVDSPAVQAALAEAKGLAVSSQIAATNAQISMLAARDSVGYENLDKAAKLSYTNPETAAGLAYAGQVVTGAGAMAAGGAKLGGTVAQGKGAIVGGVLGGIVGAIGSMLDGSAERYAEAAAEAARSSNAQSQVQTEQLAKALAKGDLIDTGGKYELRKGLSDLDFKLLYSELDTSNLSDFYSKVGDSTEALKEFGSSLIETETQTSAYYDSIAAQIYHNIDQSGWNNSTKATAGGLIDGKRVDAAADKIVTELAETDMLDKNLSEELVSRRTAAIQKAYGNGAQLKENDDGGYDIVDAKGETVRANVTSNDLKNLVASTEAQTEVENMAKNMPKITEKLIKQFGGTEKENEALVAALSNESGEELTQEQLAYLEKLVNDTDFKEKFDNSEILKEAFGSITNFKETFFNPTKNARDSFNKTDAFFANKGLSVSGLTSGALLGLSSDERLGSLYSKASASEIETFKTKFNGLMNYSNAEEIAAYMNTIDWSNQEDLRRMQYELHEQFGVTEEDAKGLADSMIEANDAMSHIDSTSQVFGALYQATQRVNRALEKTADLQWDYERLLNKNADATELAANLEKQRASILEEGMAAFDSHDAALEKMYDTYANGVNLINGVDLTEYVKFDPNTGEFNVSELQDRIDAMKNADDKKAAEEWMKQLVEANELAWDQIDIAKEAYEKLEEMAEAAEEAYWSIYEEVGSLITTELEQEIELQEKILDATESANSRLLSKIQEQIDVERQREQNEETEKSISDLRNQLNYLGMDTSGANDLRLLELEKEIAESEKDYQESLVDQQIQSIEDANKKAEEQRERQIELQEQQLELYKKSPAYQQNIQSKMDAYFAEYNAHQERQAAWESDMQLWEQKNNASNAELQKYEDAYNMSFQEFKDKYGETSEEQYLEFQAIHRATDVSAAKPDPFSPQDTELGKEMVMAGFTKGMNPQELDKFWSQLGANTATAADYANGTLDSGTEMQELLDAIKNNTALENLAIAEYSTGLRASQEKENEVYKDTGFNLAGSSDITSFRKEVPDGNGGTKSSFTADSMAAADEYITRTAQAYSNRQALKDSNDRAAGTKTTIDTYKSIMDEDGELMEGPLTQDQFYGELNKNGSYTYNGRTFTAENLTKSLAAGGTTDSYEDYLNTYVASSEYQSNYGGAVARSNKRDKLEKKLGEKLETWQTEPGFTGAQGSGSFRNLDEYKKLREQYEFLGGEEADFVRNGVDSMGGLSYGIVPGAKWEYIDGFLGFGGKNAIKLGEDNYITGNLPTIDDDSVPQDVKNMWPKLKFMQPYMYNGTIYVRFQNGGWHYFTDIDTTKFRENLRYFKTGGLADFTGPAWLDGTPSRPEYILNAKQTERFFTLVDVLDSFKDKDVSGGKSGDNYFEIEINVEKLENDYDVEKMANKIRSMIYEDATYRNVNAVNHIR